MDRGVRGAFGEVVLDHEFHGWARMDSGGAGGFGVGVLWASEIDGADEGE